MRIFTDDNGVYVNAISTDSTGKDVEGHLYTGAAGTKLFQIEFQHGAVRAAQAEGVHSHSLAPNVNGVTNEALLAILIHRTQVLNKRFPCRENSLAITKMEEAKMWFDKRTADRQARGVEGKETA